MRSQFFLIVFAFPLLASAQEKEKEKAKKPPPTPIAIAEVQRTDPVDFEREILPILRRNCLACHNAKDKENDLNLETPQAILSGGAEGPVVVPGKSGESRLLQLAAHQKQAVMPPEKNDRKAVNLTGQELGLIKLWIDQGAKGSVVGSTVVKWQPLAPTINPIYAVAVTPDGQFAACSRANKIFIYQTSTGKLVGQLVDPALAKGGAPSSAADLDLIQSLAFHPDGDLLASGAFRTVKLWKRPTNAKLAEFISAEAIQAVAVSANGKWAACGDAVGNIKLLDLTSAKEVKILMGHTGPVTSLKFSPDSAMVMSGSQDKSICLWSVPDGELTSRLSTPAPVNAVAFVAAGAQIASGHADNLIRLWPLPVKTEGVEAQPAKELKGHSGAVTALDFASNVLVSGSEDGTLRTWNLENGQVAKTYQHGGPVTSVALRADAKRIASCSSNNSAKLFNVESGQQVAEVKGDLRAQQAVAKLERAGNILKAKVTDQNKAVTETQDRAKKETDAIAKAETAKAAAEKAAQEKTEAAKKPVEAKEAAGKEVETAQEEAKAAAEKLAEAKTAAANDKDNKELAKGVEETNKAVAAADTKLKAAQKKVTDLTKPAEQALQDQKNAEAALVAAVRAIESAMESAKSAEQAVEQAKATVEDLKQQQQAQDESIATAKKAAVATEQPLRAVAFSDNGLLFTGGDDHLIHSYNADSGLPVGIIDGNTAAVLALAAAPGGVLSGSADKQVVDWDGNPPWALIRTIGGPNHPTQLVDRVISLDFSPDGKLLATGGGEPSRSGELKLWNVADGTCVREAKDPHSDAIFCVRFSPDGLLLATSSGDRFMKIFRVADGKFVRSFEGHTHHVLGVTWKPDGKQLATAGGDNVVKVWDMTTGEQKRTIQGFGKEVTALATVGDTVNVVASCGDKSLKLINLDSGAAGKTYATSNDFVYAVAASADGKLFIAGGQDSVLRTFTVESTAPTQTMEPAKGK